MSMSKSERLRALLERGYFPSEMPPPFHTSDLAKYRDSVLNAWPKVNQDYPATVYEVYSVPRIKRVRRNLAIVNPIAQVHLSRLVADEWVEIRKHLRKSKYALEVPEISADAARAVPRPDFSLVAFRRTEISADFDHALVSDISRFYGTLYTHAIAWALHTKAWCKLNLHQTAFKSSLGNRLDIATRKAQDNQTIGIPTGPDTSRIVSEIIGVAIDQFVQSTLKLDRNRSFRHVDDWYIGFENAGQAEDAIATLATACRSFELELNADKTRTLHASSSVDAIWPTELREYAFPREAIGQAKALEHYLVKAFHYAAEYPGHNVLDFAVKRTASLRIFPDNWRGYETFLLKAARSNQTVVPTVVEILVSYNFNGFPLKRERIGKLIEDLVLKNAPLAHHAEVAWALFLAKALRISPSKAVAQAVSGLESSTCALLALDLRERGLIASSLDVSLWQQSMALQGLRSNMWLLTYEADLKGWMSGANANFVAADPYFGALKSRNISFYDTNKNVAHIRKRKPPRRSAAFFQFLLRSGAMATPSADTSLSPY